MNFDKFRQIDMPDVDAQADPTYIKKLDGLPIKRKSPMPVILTVSAAVFMLAVFGLWMIIGGAIRNQGEHIAAPLENGETVVDTEKEQKPEQQESEQKQQEPEQEQQEDEPEPEQQEPEEVIIEVPEDNAESKRDESLGKEYPEDEKGDNYNTGHGEEEKYDLQDHTDDPLRYIGDYIVSNHDFEELPSHTMVEAEYTSYNFMPIDELEKEVLSQNGIVIRGIKKENSTQYTSKDEEVWFSETPIEILEVYAGDAKVGDSIIMYEDAGVLHSETGKCIVALINGNHPIKKETEYILFLYPGTSISGSGERIYVPHDSHLSNGLGRQKITEQIKSAKTSEEAGLEGLKKDIFDRYYFK